MKPPRKLHLGCGSHRPGGWVNVDGSWNARLVKIPFLRKILGFFHLVPEELLRIQWDPHVFICDVRKPLPFTEGSAEIIYASHLLDCLHLFETKRLLKECFRVLRPGGVLRVVVEDIRPILQEYLDGHPRAHLSEELARLRPADRLMARLLCESPEAPRGGFLYKLYRRVTDFQTRKWAYDADSLKSHLKEAGFGDVSEKKFLDSQIPKIEEVEKSHGVCVEGIRPHG